MCLLLWRDETHECVFWHSAAERVVVGDQQWSGSTGGEVIIPAVTWSLITPSILCVGIKAGLMRALRERSAPELFVCLIVKKKKKCILQRGAAWSGRHVVRATRAPQQLGGPQSRSAVAGRPLCGARLCQFAVNCERFQQSGVKFD